MSALVSASRSNGNVSGVQITGGQAGGDEVKEAEAEAKGEQQPETVVPDSSSSLAAMMPTLPEFGANKSGKISLASVTMPTTKAAAAADPKLDVTYIAEIDDEGGVEPGVPSPLSSPLAGSPTKPKSVKLNKFATIARVVTITKVSQWVTEAPYLYQGALPRPIDHAPPHPTPHRPSHTTPHTPHHSTPRPTPTGPFYEREAPGVAGEEREGNR